jgi:hypothetical protein
MAGIGEQGVCRAAMTGRRQRAAHGRVGVLPERVRGRRERKAPSVDGVCSPNCLSEGWPRIPGDVGGGSKPTEFRCSVDESGLGASGSQAVHRLRAVERVKLREPLREGISLRFFCQTGKRYGYLPASEPCFSTIRHFVADGKRPASRGPSINQQLPFFACPGGQNPFPGPPCGATTTGGPGTYATHPPSAPTTLAAASHATTPFFTSFSRY